MASRSGLRTASASSGHIVDPAVVVVMWAMRCAPKAKTGATRRQPVDLIPQVTHTRASSRRPVTHTRK
eukprot:801090-Prymnesium_polylepis.1